MIKMLLKNLGFPVYGASNGAHRSDIIFFIYLRSAFLFQGR